MAENKELMEKVISLSKRRGFIFQGSEIYGGLAGTWDYGPMGTLLKENIKALWLKMFRDMREDMYGLDAAIIMNPKVWEASGHVSTFTDPFVDCKNCHYSTRVDHLENFDELEFNVVRKEFFIKFNEWIDKFIDESDDKHMSIDQIQNKAETILDTVENQKLDNDQKIALIEVAKKMLMEAKKLLQEEKEKIATARSLNTMLEKSIKLTGIVTEAYLNRFVDCPKCSKKNWGVPDQFNLMFSTSVGAGEEATISYLRPETAQGMFVNFKNVMDSIHPKLPFGLAQIGKAFRNEISPRDFIFRSREFEQMEIEYFVKESEWETHFEHWRVKMHEWMQKIGLKDSMVHELEVPEYDRAHYSKRTIDFEFDFPFGRKELYGLAYRTDFDLKNHSTASGVSMEYMDEESGQKFIPHVIEPTFGVDRTVLAVLASAYAEDDKDGDVRTYLKLPKELAPIRAAVFPLLKNKPELVAKAKEVREMLQNEVHSWIAWDDNGNIGKRYRRQDEIGTPHCITIDFDTLGETPELKDTVTLRNRDTGEQERVNISDLKRLLS